MEGEEYALRAVRLDELPRMMEIEDEAGRLYGTVGIDPDLPGLSPEELARGHAEGLLWTITDPSDRPIAFALCRRWPGTLHLREINVSPSHMRRGLGRRLLDHVCEHARHENMARVTLTTFTDVPWNAPMYGRYGFVELQRESMPQWLQAIRDEENAGCLAAWPRIAMALTTATVC